MTAPLLGPFQQLDPPTIQVLNQPPAVPTFVDGQLVHQGDLNALSANVQYLQEYVLGGSQGGTAAKPMTVLRAVLPNVNLFTATVATLIQWDTADVNNDNAWSATADPFTIYVQHEGFYRIYFQCGSTATSSHWSSCAMFILVNGSDIANNSVQSCGWVGNQGNLELTVPLAATASIQVAYMQSDSTLTSGRPWQVNTQFGGCRIEVEWVAPTIPPPSQ